MRRLLPRVPSANDLPGDASSARLPDDLLDDQIKRFVVVAYVLLTGEPVFGGATTMQTLLDHVSAVPIPPSTRAPMPVPAWLDALVLACLEKDTARRPASATQPSS